MQACTRAEPLAWPHRRRGAAHLRQLARGHKGAKGGAKNGGHHRPQAQEAGQGGRAAAVAAQQVDEKGGGGIEEDVLHAQQARKERGAQQVRLLGGRHQGQREEAWGWVGAGPGTHELPQLRRTPTTRATARAQSATTTVVSAGALACPALHSPSSTPLYWKCTWSTSSSPGLAPARNSASRRAERGRRLRMVVGGRG